MNPSRKKAGPSGRWMAPFLIMALLTGVVSGQAPSYAAEDQRIVIGTVDVRETALPADGTSRTVVSLSLADGQGNPVSLPPEDIRFSSTSGRLEEGVSITGPGEYTSVLTAPTTAGVAYIGAFVDGKAVADMASVSFTAGPPSPARSVITASRLTVPADGSSQSIITVQLKDEFGNDVSEQAGLFELSATLGALSSVTYATNGRYETSLVSAKYGKLGTLKGLSGMPGPVDDPLELNDEQGAIPPEAPNGEDIPVMIASTYESSGAYQAVLMAPLSAGTAQITASLNGLPVASSVEVEFTEGSPPNPINGLRFGHTSYSVTSGRTHSTSLEAVRADGSTANVASFASYEVQNALITTVDAHGTVTGLRSGQTKLTATYEGFTAETTITVTEDPGNGTTPEDPGGTPTPGNPSSPVIPTENPASPGLSFEIVSKDGGSSRQTLSKEDVLKGRVELQIGSGGGTISISAANLKELRSLNPKAIIVMREGAASMNLPLSELDLSPYSRQFGIPEESIRCEITIREPDEPTRQAIRDSVSDMGGRLLSNPLAFEVQITGSTGKSVWMSSFSQYVTRILTVQGDPVPDTATGVWWVPERNELRFVPTHFAKQDGGQWTAVMKRQGASIYAVIDRPLTFADTAKHWAGADVELLGSKLVVQGRREGVFAPDADITRAEIAALLVRALGLNESDARNPFSDTGSGWYVAAVNTAYQAGLISGYIDGTFRPMQKITRQELAGMMVRAMNYAGGLPSGSLPAYRPYGDEMAISGWAREYVQYAQQAGIVGGDGIFRPLSYSTRAETVTMLKRMLKLVQFI
ncbi:invasin domain 3-containing protein [Cohnella endophytica]|uniref:invasin domain 3-containing protein n=1 Tax=Cohnella endophytica TaxID=2419778 RepID=UPI0013144980|nr:invasin domain 3-containing protein [Cohnella endophytica]